MKLVGDKKSESKPSLRYTCLRVQHLWYNYAQVHKVGLFHHVPHGITPRTGIDRSNPLTHDRIVAAKQSCRKPSFRVQAEVALFHARGSSFYLRLP